MLRTSRYTMIIENKNEAETYLLVHGYTGAVDVVNKEIVDVLTLGNNHKNAFDLLDKMHLEILKKRGYVTEKNLLEEKQALCRVSESLKEVHNRQMAITLIPTYNCNFRCTYCFEHQLLSKGKAWLQTTMSHEMVDQVMMGIDDLRTQGKEIRDLWLFGGEPLLKENVELIAYIVEKAKEKALTVRCVSNGYDLEHFDHLLGKDKIEVVQITIDGIASTHDCRRYRVGKQPTHKHIMSNIDHALHQSDARVMVRSNLDHSNLGEVEEIMQGFRHRGWLEHPNFSNYFKSVHACYSKEEKPLTDVVVMNTLKAVLPNQTYAYQSLYQSLEMKFKQMFSTQSYAPFKSDYCGAASGGLCIDPFGDLYPCWDVIGKESEKVGSLAQGQFQLNDRYDYWINRSVHHIETCVNCSHALFCGGGCPAHAQVTNDNAYTAYCDNFKEIFNEVVPNVYHEYKRFKEASNNEINE